MPKFLPEIPQHEVNNLRYLARMLQNLGPVRSTAPTVDDLKDGDCVLYESGETRRVYFNINGTIRYITIGTGTLDLHAIDDEDSHSGTATENNLLKADANGLPTDSGYGVKDEDDMVSDSAVDLATQQSVKAYVDDNIGASNEAGLFETDENEDWMPIDSWKDKDAFDLDGNLDLQPTAPSAPYDEYYEFDANKDIMPKA